MKKFFLFQLVFIFLLPSLVFSKESVDLGEIIVEETKKRAEKPSLDSTSAATVLIPDQSKQESATIPKLLEQSAGVHVKRYGRLDDFSTLSLRGSSSGQVQVYLDDVPLVTAQGSVIDLSIVPLSVVDRVEVYRGGSPGILPDSAVGGVVLLKSKSSPESLCANAELSIGSFETAKGKLNYADSIKFIAPIIAYEYSRSNGAFTYLDDNGTRFNKADDAIATRENNDFSSSSLYTKLGFNLREKFSLSLTNLFFEKEEGVPGLGSRKSLNARLNRWHDIVSLALDKGNLFFEPLDGHFSFFFDYLNSKFSDPLAEVSLSAEDSDDDIFRFGSNLRLGIKAGGHQKFNIFIANRSEFYSPYDSLNFSSNSSNRQSLNAGIEEEIRLFKDRFTLIPSIRIENLFNDGSLPTESDHQLSFKLGSMLRLVDEFYFKGNVYRGFRNPTFSELFGNMGSLQGNAGLLAEKAINFDAGLSYDIPVTKLLSLGHVETVFFRNDMDRLIQYLQTSTFTAMATNMNRALIYGIESMAVFKFLGRFRTTASYTYQSAKDASGSAATDGNYLPSRPQHELYFLLAWEEGWLSWLTSSLFYDLRYMSENYLDTQNLLRIDNRMILGSGLSVRLADRFSIFFSVQNILNDRISDLIGYPLPGRSYWGTVEIKL